MDDINPYTLEKFKSGTGELPADCICVTHSHDARDLVGCLSNSHLDKGISIGYWDILQDTLKNLQAGEPDFHLL